MSRSATLWISSSDATWMRSYPMISTSLGLLVFVQQVSNDTKRKGIISYACWRAGLLHRAGRYTCALVRIGQIDLIRGYRAARWCRIAKRVILECCCTTQCYDSWVICELESCLDPTWRPVTLSAVQTVRGKFTGGQFKTATRGLFRALNGLLLS